MVDTSGIDIKAVIDQLACVAWAKPVRSHGERVYKGGPCPFCGQGRDRFAVFPEADKPHFYCGIHGNGCGAHGDVISFIQQLKGYHSASLAIRELQEMGYQIGGQSLILVLTRRNGEGKLEGGSSSREGKGHAEVPKDVYERI